MRPIPTIHHIDPLKMGAGYENVTRTPPQKISGGGFDGRLTGQSVSLRNIR
jgi:hypothetical protein